MDKDSDRDEQLNGQKYLNEEVKALKDDSKKSDLNHDEKLYLQQVSKQLKKLRNRLSQVDPIDDETVTDKENSIDWKTRVDSNLNQNDTKLFKIDKNSLLNTTFITTTMTYTKTTFKL